MKPDPHKSHSSAATLTASSRADLTSPETERVNNTLRAYREIRKRILSGDMPAGAQFLEQELAELLGMSRTPVREALIRLQDERLVVVRPRHGATVLGISAQELSDIYDIASDLEASAIRRVAAAGLTSETRHALTRAITEMDGAAQANDLKSWITWDDVFHETVVEATGNLRLIEIYKRLMAQVYRARHSVLAHETISASLHGEHRAITAAIEARDAERAHRLMQEHRVTSRTALVERLRQTAHVI